MNEYHARLGINLEATSQNDGVNNSGDKPGYMSLAEVYGLPDDMMLGPGSGRQQVQSVDQEYSD